MNAILGTPAAFIGAAYAGCAVASQPWPHPPPNHVQATARIVDGLPVPDDRRLEEPGRGLEGRGEDLVPRGPWKRLIEGELHRQGIAFEIL